MNLNINWYPGHMKKSIDEIKNMLKLSDIVADQCPKSGLNRRPTDYESAALTD